SSLAASSNSWFAPPQKKKSGLHFGLETEEMSVEQALFRALADKHAVTCRADLAVGDLGRGLFAQQVLARHDTHACRLTWTCPFMVSRT
ncbi:MAG: hypothetical protein ACPIOQ_33095, partial [Promethearchaeia archaeon]